MTSVQVRSGDLESARCAYCHDDVGVEPLVCARCGAACHAACRGELGRCPSLACVEEKTVAAPSRSLARARVMVGALCLAAAIVALAMLRLDPPQGPSAPLVNFTMPIFAVAFVGLGAATIAQARRRST